MLHIFFGSDRGRVRDSAAEHIESKKAADATVTTIEAGQFESGQLEDALGATSLFGGEEWFILDTPSDNADFDEAVTEVLAELAASANTFVILEGALLAPAKKKYQKHATTFEEFTAEKTERFNTFAMADALASRDKRRLWVLLQEAKLSGSREEEVIGILWWQLKTLRLAAQTASAAEAGMKDFPYNKAKRSLGGFAPGEIERLSQSLLQVYHDGHGGVRDIDLALERWVLEGK